MARVVYGVWDGTVLDNRGKCAHEIPEIADLKGFDAFNEGNAIRAFFGDRGFYVFDPRVNLTDALRQHMARSADESCGKCTPCRMGTALVRDALTAMAEGREADLDLDEIEALAVQMRDTSLCGLGQTCANALIGVFEHFRDVIEGEKAKAKPVTSQPFMAYTTAPCIEACPSRVNVPRYIDYIKDGRPAHSLGVVLQKYPMAATCGRVCVRLCEMACRRNLVDQAVGIKVLKRYVADQQKGPKADLFSRDMITDPKPDSLRVAVVGAGPSGVAAAYHLLLKGFHVDVFEAQKQAGGMAAVGIPSYRLPKDVLKSENDIIEKLGGRFFYEKALGKDFSVDDLFAQGYKAIYIAVGCSQGTRLGAKDEDPTIKGYDSGISFLLKVHDHVAGTHRMRLEGEVAVVGGGNVAMDCVRSALRMGASKVHLIYRRTKEDMPADHEEIEASEKEGVVFHYLTNPTRIISENGQLKGIELVKMRQTEKDARGRRSVEPIPGSEVFFKCDLLIPAIGQQVDVETLKPADGVNLDKWNCVAADKQSLMTSRPGVFAGGDCQSGASTLIAAMAAGLKAARSIEDYLMLGRVRFFPRSRMRELLNQHKMLASDCIEVPVKGQYRVHHPELDPEVRKQMFEEVEGTISAEEAYHEAQRCLRCYRVYSVVTETAIPEGVV